MNASGLMQSQAIFLWICGAATAPLKAVGEIWAGLCNRSRTKREGAPMFLHVTSVLATLKQRVKKRGKDEGGEKPVEGRATGKADRKPESSKRQR